jgi:preprotein translocase subunit SecG
MGWTNIAIDILLFFFVIVSVLMCLVVLMQRSKQEGLGAAFGGGFTESVWGAQTSQVLVKATVWLAALFFITSISLARLYSHRASLMEKGSPLQQELMKPVAPASTNFAPTTVVVPPAEATPAAAPAAPEKPAAK